VRRQAARIDLDLDERWRCGGRQQQQRKEEDKHCHLRACRVPSSEFPGRSRGRAVLYRYSCRPIMNCCLPQQNLFHCSCPFSALDQPAGDRSADRTAAAQAVKRSVALRAQDNSSEGTAWSRANCGRGVRRHAAQAAVPRGVRPCPRLCAGSAAGAAGSPSASAERISRRCSWIGGLSSLESCLRVALPQRGGRAHVRASERRWRSRVVSFAPGFAPHTAARALHRLAACRRQSSGAARRPRRPTGASHRVMR
jgi:hypothetical protein